MRLSGPLERRLWQTGADENQKKNLYKDISNEDSVFSDISKGINRDLHYMADHLRRYSSELGTLDSIITELVSQRGVMSRGASSTEREKRKTERLVSELGAITRFYNELEVKLKSTLNLVRGTLEQAHSSQRGPR